MHLLIAMHVHLLVYLEVAKLCYTIASSGNPGCITAGVRFLSLIAHDCLSLLPIARQNYVS